MWVYEKRLQYPVKIKNPDPKIAQFIMSQYGGPDCRNLSGIMGHYFASPGYCNAPSWSGVRITGSVAIFPSSSR